ncbi:MAG: OsmC family protein [Bdellovibrionales bacterium]|nr:OsmC family protein [Bdellovibrionales bacterium]
MSSYVMYLDWKKEGSDFSYEKFNRNHINTFSGNQTLNTSAAPEYLGSADMTNPEELLGSALVSCHLLTFLAICSKSGYVVERFSCKTEAFLAKNEEGKMFVNEITLTPKIEFIGDRRPTDEQLIGLHEKAHRNCFISNSLKTKINFSL